MQLPLHISKGVTQILLERQADGNHKFKSPTFVALLSKFSAAWCVGSSIIKHAFLACLRTGEINLGLEKLGMKIWWQGYAGLKFTDLKKKVMYLTRLEEKPDFLVIHFGGNDLGDLDWPLVI